MSGFRYCHILGVVQAVSAERVVCYQAFGKYYHCSDALEDERLLSGSKADS